MSDYVAKVTYQEGGKVRHKNVPLGNIAELAVKMAMDAAQDLEEQGAVVELTAGGKWAATFGPGGWINTVRPMRRSR